DPFGFEPVAVALDDLDAPPDEEHADWRVRFGPSRAAVANGGEPLLVIREIERLGGHVVSVDSTALPALRELDPEDSYFVWSITVTCTVARAALNECFDFVAPDSLIEISRGDQSPRAAEDQLPPEAQVALPDETAEPTQRADVPEWAAMPPDHTLVDNTP